MDFSNPHPGSKNVKADKNFKMFEQSSEWELTEDVDIGLFTSKINHQLSKDIK